MCGIAGIIALSDKGIDKLDKINTAVSALSKRGPDGNGIYTHHRVALGHARLSIIDTSTAGSQPMTDASGRYTIIFNGEFVNFQEHRDFVLEKGIHLKSESDTEILLYLYIIEGEKCLQRINGFFAFAVYDKEEETVFIARDRFGEKPLLYYEDENNFLFASEMKALAAMDIPQAMDEVSLFIYLQQNYISAPHSIYKGVKKLMPGCFLKVAVGSNRKQQEAVAGGRRQQSSIFQYYELKKTTSPLSYPDQQKKLVELLDAAVQKRLISDVPIGAFLSGGIDSSVIVALATQHTKQLNTFSIGFRDEPLFDETKYANLVAKKCNTTHTVFSLTNNDLFENLFEMLDYLDEPFADSSALNVYILSKHTRKHATVALSGDGADELFGGYNKHAAELKAQEGGTMASMVKMMNPLFDFLPQSRNSKTGNKIRQLKKFSDGMKLTAKQRYWSWAGYATPLEAEHLLKNKTLTTFDRITEYSNRKNQVLQYLRDEGGDMNDVLLTDVHGVLPNDMLTKVDLMSMANSLEVRPPFLDHTVVDFAFSLPVSSKIDEHGRKKIVRDAFRNYLPVELYNRPKQGFEVPLLKWFRNELKSFITDDLLADKFISDQAIFDLKAIGELKQKLFSNSPGDAVAQVWALIVFQYWWRKYFV